MELWELNARESIRDLVARYNATGDSGRFDPLMELFWEDAEMDISTGTFVGHDEILSIFTGTAERWSGDGTSGSGSDAAGVPVATHVRHNVSTLVIDMIDETHAKGYCYFSVVMPHGLDHWGRYFDKFEARDGVWKFARRKVVGDGSQGQVAPPR